MRSIWEDDTVPLDAPLWRYFRADRFVAALETSSLYFPSARQFEDRFEGAVAVVAHTPIDPRYAELEGADGAFEQLRRLTKISCWHHADYESDAMWKLYAASHKGVAVRTTTGRLQDALRPFCATPKSQPEEPFWGSVRYADLRRERLRVNMVQRFFHKHRAFEWEREFRVIISLRSAEEFGVEVPEFGIELGLEPACLIEELCLGPEIAEDDCNAVVAACENAGVGDRLVTSTLLGRPRYT